MAYRDALLGAYHIRKTKGQKTAFVDYAKKYATDLGYPVSISGKGDKVRNVVIGDPKRAKVVYTAHYDTQPVMLLPNFITPKNIFVYILYQILVISLLIALPLGAALSIGRFVPELEKTSIPVLIFLVLYYSELALMLCGPANKHTANDNTSGVATVFGIMERLKGRGDVAFILFDCEEKGLLGSKIYAKQNKDLMATKLLVNFDCVSDGKNMMFVFKKGSAARVDEFKRAFVSNEIIECLYETRGVFNPSDQMSFPMGVGVMSLHRTRFGLYYANKIHTPRDTVFDTDNINYLIDGAEKFCDVLASENVASTPENGGAV